MSSLQGEIVTTYKDLTNVFGKPTYGPDMTNNKSTCEWVIEFEDGTKGYIYDWKEEKTIYGKYNWHIGGTSSNVVDKIYELLIMIFHN